MKQKVKMQPKVISFNASKQEHNNATQISGSCNPNRDVVNLKQREFSQMVKDLSSITRRYKDF